MMNPFILENISEKKEQKGFLEIQNAFETAKKMQATHRKKIPEAYSYSALKAFFSGLSQIYPAPYKIIEYYFQEKTKPTTNVFLIGKLVEILICTSVEEAEESYLLYNGRITNNIKEEASLKGKEPVSRKIWEDCLKMATSAKTNIEIRETLKNEKLKQQEEISSICPLTSLNLKGILDLRLDSHVIDIKTTSFLSEFEFLIEQKFHYWIQAAVYYTLTNCTKFSFFAISSQKPYFSKWFSYEEEQLRKWQLKLQKEILIPLLNCLEEGFGLP